MNYQEPEPLIVGGITDEMVEAARNELAEGTFGGVAPHSTFVRAALAAALAAAPTVGVLCPPCHGSGYAALDAHHDCGDCYDRLHPCPDCGGTGWRRAILLGPEREVEA